MISKNPCNCLPFILQVLASSRAKKKYKLIHTQTSSRCKGFIISRTQVNMIIITSDSCKLHKLDILVRQEQQSVLYTVQNRIMVQHHIQQLKNQLKIITNGIHILGRRPFIQTILKRVQKNGQLVYIFCVDVNLFRQHQRECRKTDIFEEFKRKNAHSVRERHICT